MEISTDRSELDISLQGLRKNFLLTAYGCRIAIADRLNKMKYSSRAFGEIEEAVKALTMTSDQLHSRIPKSFSLSERTCYQSTIAAIAELQSKSNEFDGLKFRQWSNFNNLEPRDKFPLELDSRIEMWPTFWQFAEGQELDRISNLTLTARKLQNNIIPPLPDLIHLGHFSCAIVNATDDLIDRIS